MTDGSDGGSSMCMLVCHYIHVERGKDLQS